MDNRNITPDMARKELARRELDKRGVSLNPPNDKSQQLSEISKTLGVNRTPLDTLRDLLQGGLSGLGKGGQFLASSLTGGTAPTVNMDQIFSGVGSPNPSPSGQLVKGIGEYAPFAIAGGSSILGELGAGALSGASQSSPGESPIMAALKGAGLNLGGIGALKALETLRPSNLFRGNLSPEQLQKNVEVTQRTNTGLGDVIGSPFLKRQYENILPYLPFNKANETMLNTVSQIKNKGNELLNDIGINKDIGDQRAALQRALKEASQDSRKEKQLNYQKLNEIADKDNLKIGRENFSQQAKDALEDINASPELKREFPSDILSDLENYSSNQKGNNLKLSNIFKGKLGDKANEFYTQGRMHEYGIIKGLQDSLQKDIDSSIENSGNSALKDQYLKSQKEYREKFAPFEDPDIVKFTRQGGDSDLLLSYFLKSGSNDRSNLLRKLIDKLPPKSSQLPLQMYLSKSIENGEVNPLTLKTLYNKLGDNQKNVLITDKSLRNKLEDYSDLVSKNTEPLTNMVNPKTGQRNLDVLTAGIMGLLGRGIGGNYGALASSILPIATGRMATNYLTSPSVRESLVKAIIENKPKFNTPGPIQSTQGLLQAISNMIGQRNQ